MFCKDKRQVKNIASLSNIRITKEFFVIVQDIVDFYYHIWKELKTEVPLSLSKQSKRAPFCLLFFTRAM
jgi:hypothetical protein